MVAKVFYEEPPFATEWKGGGESNADIIYNPCLSVVHLMKNFRKN